MNIRFTQVDAFIRNGQPLTGNPAAVMQLDAWLPDDILLAIAIENNLSETAFLKPSEASADWDLRWFTPGKEVDMCGHATIASGHVLIGDADEVTFATRSGELAVKRGDASLLLDLPGASAMVSHDDPALVEALGVDPRAVMRATSAEDALVVLLDEECAVRACRPDFAALAPYGELVIVTAPGDGTDIASRVFAVSFGIDEDPVTGAAHAAIAPWWAERLGKTRFTAIQASERGGHLECHVKGDRVELGGQCVTVIEGTFRL